MSSAAIAGHLSELCHRLFGVTNPVADLRRLTGGASMESWSFTCDDNKAVLRRADLVGGEKPQISLSTEAAVITLAEEHGVSVPPIIGVLEPSDQLGEGFVMGWIEGETLPQRVLNNPDFAIAQRALTQQAAHQLALIHAIPLDAVPDDVERRNPNTLLADLRDRYQQAESPEPVFDFAFAWLNDHLPAPGEPALLHGDFRMGNLMIDRAGIAAVLDWELCHVGEPAQDLAYLCTPSWRFGRYDKPVGGFGEIDDLLDAYRSAGGRVIDRTRFDYWLVYSTLWWGVYCLGITTPGSPGPPSQVERGVIGRRVSEVFVDLLLLFESLLDLPKAAVDWNPPSTETDDTNLFASLIEWATAEVIPRAEGDAQYRARVARNALGMLQRANELGPTFAEGERQRLAELNVDATSLCEELGNGSRSLADERLLAHVRTSALEQLAIDQPSYPGFAVALEQWNSH